MNTCSVYPPEFDDLMNFYAKLPGVGEKSAERHSLATLEMSDEEINAFSDALKKAKSNLHPCKKCGFLTNKELCDICTDDTRNKNLICVVEDYKSVFNFEKTGNYRGLYHVLNGLISPTEGIGYEDINISSLIDQVDKLEKPELILALKSSIEGETTTLFIKKILENKNVIISRLSYGIPMGADIDYLDTTTLNKALDDRKQIS